ncbi:MAG TPA: GerMN domain-containing protein [Epulopiscium sp.]|nr:GerMN domain-containing protein [Candidatus Epulonipiscium sp.]
MKSKYKSIYKIVGLVLIVLLMASCSNQVSDDEIVNKEEINVYFVNQVDGKLVSEKIYLDPKEIDTDEKKVRLAIGTIEKGPQSTSLSPIIPNDVKIQTIELVENGAKISFSSQYHDLSVQKQMIMRASFVRTLTYFPFINWVEFLVDKEPLLSPEGLPIGPIFKDDIVLVQPDPKPPTNQQNIVLYFTDEQAMGLVAENRKIQISNNVPLERYIVEELIKGPQNKNNIATVPPETKINDIKTIDGVCQIDLSAEFKSKHPGGSTGEIFTVYSIVNSLTESSPKVKKVVFLIDGKKQTEYKGHLDLSILFERDESLIEEK